MKKKSQNRESRWRRSEKGSKFKTERAREVCRKLWKRVKKEEVRKKDTGPKSCKNKRVSKREKNPEKMIGKCEGKNKALGGKEEGL